VAEEHIKQFQEAIGDLLRKRLSEGPREFKLSMSKLGKPECQLWYDKHVTDDGLDSEGQPYNQIKFIFGDLIEQLVLFLAKEAGHTVTDEQKKVEFNGVTGHIDAVIDGVLVDSKSCSSYSFNSWSKGGVASDDAFGYMEQITGYAVATGSHRRGFLLVDKQLGKLHLDLYQSELRRDEQVIHNRVERLNEVLSSGSPPQRCFSDEPMGKSGNKKLGLNCSYCTHKYRCWADANDGIGLRTFVYSGGPTFLTQVEREPDVFESTFYNKKKGK
jgi:hypothetical protein